MSESWFIDPSDIVRLKLDLPGDHWIEVKRELGFAEESALMGAMVGDFKASGKKGASGKTDVMDATMDIDMKKFQIARFSTWIVDWNATTKDGKTIPITKDAIANLRSPIAAAIDAALDAHIGAVEAEGKARTGEGGPGS